MNSSTYSHIAQAWQFIEETSMSADTADIQSVRAQIAHKSTVVSSSLAAFIGMQAQLIQARNVLIIGLDSGIEIPVLTHGLGEASQLTVVTPSADDAQRTRSIFDSLRSPHTGMRCVSTDVKTFLHRLNAHDYDMIVVSSEAENYAVARDEVARLLRDGGMLILTDVMALTDEKSEGGVPNPADRHDKAVILRSVIDELMHDEMYTTALLSIATGVLMAIVHQ